ncbi:Hpt domain-containing protein [Flavicella sediminum]|uniref:Hpt domain-containing protein n=1 Tax=Flavicella sediminum TaxID=2585141 RepID=UPI00111D9D66|nr:Hpt domain-containing protein [Flavicella sediminum]
MHKSQILHSTIVDLNLLNEGFQGETDLQIQLIAVFLEQTPEKIALIKSAISEANHLQIKEATHFLKSTFSTMGVRLHQEFSEIETMARTHEKIETISALFEKSLPIYEMSYKEYEKLLAQLKNTK